MISKPTAPPKYEWVRPGVVRHSGQIWATTRRTPIRVWLKFVPRRLWVPAVIVAWLVAMAALGYGLSVLFEP